MNRSVIPAEAGIQPESRGRRVWIPASAGMTRLVLDLFKLRIGFAIALTAAAGAAVAPGRGAGAAVAIAVLCVLLASAAAGGFNQYVEAELDRRMARTRGRAFATGRLKRSPAWLAVIGAMVAGATAACAWLVNPWAALHTFAGAFFYGVVYTVWLKRRTAMNIVVGGIAGSFAVLAGAAAVSPSAATAPLPLAFAWILFLWTPPHFWSLAIACRDDYAAANVPMLPVVLGEARAARIVLGATVLLVASTLLPLALGMGAIYAAGAVAGGAVFLRAAARLARRPGRDTARASFRASLLQLALLLAAAIADRVAKAMRALPALLAFALALPAGAALDAERAFGESRAAIGSRPAAHAFTDTEGRRVTLADYRGKPLVVSLVYTGCSQVCPATTRFLSKAVREARAVVGDHAFRVVSIGFDIPNDNPMSMKVFARQHGIDDPAWSFLTPEPGVPAPLARDLGFAWAPGAGGIEHLLQVTVLDGRGRVYAQVYGESFKLPMLIQPLRELVLDAPVEDRSVVALYERVKLLCTVYDPATGRYRLDLRLFIELAVGVLCLGATLGFLLRERRRTRRTA